MKPLFLFVRPPRPLWPFNGPHSAFWPPLAFASMSAELRARLPDIQIQILDAPALQMGWKTLEAEIRSRKPAYVGIGEEAVSCVEGLRLAKIAKDCAARVIAGGCFFAHVAPEALATGLIDAVVHGEGEATLVELVQAFQSGRNEDLALVKGISFRDGEAVITTPPRPLLNDLDRLPMPAYDLLPVERYGARSRNHPQLAAIELGRGCVGACDFCVLWRQMGRHNGDHPAPCLRVKSPERLREEIHVLAHRYGRRYLGWVDPCFNAHPDAPGQLAELLLKDNLILGQSAWARTDGIVRDAASGALASCVRSGLNELYLGIERPDAESLKTLNKTSDLDQARSAMRILKHEHPSVYTIGSFIYGLPGDTQSTVQAIHRLSTELELDQSFFIPLTPLPGTSEWRKEYWDPTGERFRGYNFLPMSALNSPFAALDRALLWSLMFHWPSTRLRTYFQGLCGRDARKRRVNMSLILRSIAFYARRESARIFHSKQSSGLVFPAWYDS